MSSTEKRWAAYAQEGITDPDHPERHMVAYITEGEAGYSGTTYTGDLDYCVKTAEAINDTLGHDRDTVLRIVASSMRAGSVDRPNVHTWADGFGRWHARVPKTAASPLIAARRAIRDELVERAAPTEVHGHWFLHLKRTPDYDTETGLAYAEPTIDPDQCSQCRASINTSTKGSAT